MKARPDKAPPIAAHPKLDLLSDEVAWDGRFPIQRVRFRYTRFDGTQSGILTWELWRRGNAVAVLPYDPVADTLALIEQFRLPAHASGIDPVLIECAAGLLEPGEDPEEAGRREIQEETGLTPGRFEAMGDYLLMQGGCDERVFLYAGEARLPPPGAQGLHGLAAEQEDIRLHILRAEDAFALLDTHKIKNATTAICLFWLRQHRDRLRREWSPTA